MEARNKEDIEEAKKQLEFLRAQEQDYLNQKREAIIRAAEAQSLEMATKKAKKSKKTKKPAEVKENSETAEKTDAKL